MKKTDKQDEVKFEYELGSNVIKVDEEIKYLSIVIWEEVNYEDVKSYIVE